MLKTIFNAIKILKRQGRYTFLRGISKRHLYARLQRNYGFDKWHIQPYELRPYAWDCVNYINSLYKWENGGSVCEIGCGGDITKNINMSQKFAFDVSKEAINCAKMLDEKHNGHAIEFIVGSLDEALAHLPLKLDLLITLNFIHGIPPECLKEAYEKILHKIKISNIIVDTVNDYTYSHDFSLILPNWKISKVIGVYADRKVLHLVVE